MARKPQPGVSNAALIAAYREMAADVEREQEADEWTEGLISDVAADLPHDDYGRPAAAPKGAT